MTSEATYTLIFDNDPSKTSVSEFKSLLEKPKDEIKINTMKRILISMLNGNPMPDLLMHIIRYIMPSRNKQLKKLLYVYWEIVPKLDSETGALKHEMILVCNAIRNDLQHPNEYIRGNTLKFLTKLKESELLEPLIPTVIQCLEHRHSYVRKNCIFAIDSIYKLNPDLIPDAPELLTNLLSIETDPICIRNCFIVVGGLNRDGALSFIQENLENLNYLDSLLQLAFIEFIRKDLKFSNGQLKQQYLNLIVELLDSKSSSVIYESALTLTLLANNDEVILQSGKKFIELAIKESDNNVKLICLSRIIELSKKNPGIFQDSVLDLLRILSSTDLDVKKQTLNLIIEFIDNKNVDNVIKFFKKELNKILNDDEEFDNNQQGSDKSNEYKQLLIQTINKISINFIDNSIEIVDLMLDSLPQLNSQSAYDVIAFVKEIIEKFPAKRNTILTKLINCLGSTRSGKVLRGALWILGEFSVNEKNIQDSWKLIRNNIGELPILASEKRKLLGDNDKKEETNEESKEGDHIKKSTGPVILPDGTYATENALTSKNTNNPEDSQEINQPPIRKLILDGDFYLGSIVSSTLLKLVLRFSEISKSTKIFNALKAEATLIMVSILRVGESEFVKEQIDEDSAERILSYIRFLIEDYEEEDAENEKSIIKQSILSDTRNAFEIQLEENSYKKESPNIIIDDKNINLDEIINFRLFPKSNAILNSGGFNDDDELEAITKSSSIATAKKEKLASRLSKIIPLTGFSDPVYAEGYLKVHQFDVVLDVLIVNQTSSTLRNLSVEFAVLGDLKVTDKPLSANIPAHGFHKVSTTIKVTSADTGVIFGNILYDGVHATDQTIVILNDVHIDIMDYIKPSTCSESQFRKMWNEFEWENKITIKSSTISSLSDYLTLLLSSTNMNCLTPGAVIGDDSCQFLSANLYSKSSFGEDALANLCIEKISNGPILGHVRIRSKGQGLALSLGDRIASIARKTQKPSLKIV